MGFVETVLRGVAVAVGLIFFFGVAGEIRPGLRPARQGPANGIEQRNLFFHAGKSGKTAAADPACQSRGCHGEYPHKKSVATAAFLNMHGGSVECFACHGKDAENHWTGGPGRREEGRRIRYSLPAGKFEPHTLFGKATACRSCHSDDGLARLKTRGIAGLPPGFSDPIALRMIERGGKRWDPADIR